MHVYRSSESDMQRKVISQYIELYTCLILCSLVLGTRTGEDGT